MNTKDVGDHTEAMIIAKLLEYGYTILRPVGDNQRYDLVVDLKGKFLRVQCKTGRLRQGCVMFSTSSCYMGANGRAVKRRYTKGEIDLFMVYAPWSKNIYVLRIEDAALGESRLRIEAPTGRGLRNIGQIKWARDYIFTGRLVL